MINRESGRGLELILKFIASLVLLGGFIIFANGGLYYEKLSEISKYTSPLLRYSFFIAGLLIMCSSLIIFWLAEILNHSINHTSLLLDIKTELTNSNSKNITIQNITSNNAEDTYTEAPVTEPPKPKPVSPKSEHTPNKYEIYEMPLVKNKPKKKKRSLWEFLNTDIRDLHKRKD